MHEDDLQERQSELTRGDVVLMGAVALGAVYGLSAVGPYVSTAFAAALIGEDDADTLNFLLPFEYLQLSIYEGALKEVNRHGEPMKLSEEQRGLIEEFLDEESRHIEALTVAIERLDGKPVKNGRYFFTYLNPSELFQLAESLEESATGAYNAAIPLIKSTGMRELACSIVQIEGRHAAAIALQANEQPSPTSFDPQYTQLEALNSIERFTGPAIYSAS
jgi:rubrerythrin